MSIRRWNESFYRSDPADYLLTRLELLVLAGAKRHELAGFLAEGVSYEGFTIGPDETGAAAVEGVPEESLEPFLTVESQQLLHHASETVLRVFAVHAARADVPWIELASARSFSAFKTRVREDFLGGAVSPRLVAYVCLGNSDPPADADKDEWTRAVEGLTAFLRRFAQTFLDDAPIYNGIKHGLGVAAGSAVLLIDAHQLGGGHSVEFPESDAWNGDTRKWTLTTRWLDIGESLGLVHVATQMISSMWTLGRFRHLGGSASGHLFYPVDLRPNDLRQPARLPMRRFSIGDLIETRRSTP